MAHRTLDDGKIGLLAAGSGPRSDSVKSTNGEINKVLEKAKGVTGEERRALVERGYSLIRKWCESVVEQEIFENVVRRYEPNLRMTGLSKLNTKRLEVAQHIIDPVFNKACRITEAHSQPTETLNLIPTLDELKEDWKKLTDARNSYLVET